MVTKKKMGIRASMLHSIDLKKNVAGAIWWCLKHVIMQNPHILGTVLDLLKWPVPGTIT